MAKAARHWAALVQELAEAQVVHGDLEPANVLVTKAGRLNLVDYDNMCVPALVGLPSLEVGTAPYQHPGRNTAVPLSSELDHFAALVIYTGLRALAAVPGLWLEHVEQSGRDTLLFRSEDFRDPSASSLFGDLRSSPDREVRRLAKILIKAVAAKLDQTPPLAAVLKEISGETTVRIPAGSTHVSPGAGMAPGGKHDSRVILQVVSGPIEGQGFVFDRHETFLFGRGADCHARITGDPQVSRHHFLLEVVPPRVRIRDLGSRNGIYVNGQRCGKPADSTPGDPAAAPCQAEVDLTSGDQITVGRTTINVRIELGVGATAPDTETVDFRPSAPSGTVKQGSGLDAYEMGDAVGSGTLGTVYRAVRKSDGRLVAVKIVRPAVAVS